MGTLTALAMQIEGADPNEKWAAHKAAHAAREAEQEAAAYAAEMAEEAAAGIGSGQLPYELDEEHGVVASPARVKAALENGGRAVVTVRSHKTRKHVTVVFVARKRRESGGWVPRNTSAGRVGIGGADAIEARDPDLEYPNNYVGRFYLDTGEWRAGREADGARVYAAEKVIAYALAGQELSSEVFLATECSYCGHQLKDPVSIERGVGPECYGKHTGSKAVPHA